MSRVAFVIGDLELVIDVSLALAAAAAAAAGWRPGSQVAVAVVVAALGPYNSRCLDS